MSLLLFVLAMTLTLLPKHIVHAQQTFCSSTELCHDGSFCDFGNDFYGVVTGHCRRCEWHPHMLCFGSSLSDMGMKSCVEACAARCVGKATLYVGGQEFDAVAMIGSPSTSGVSGPLIHCPEETCGHDVNASGGVCLLKSSNHSFLDMVRSCAERGGIASLVYAEWFPYETEMLWENPGIPSFGVSKEDGLNLVENSIGSVTNVSLDQSNEICQQGCSDLLPPCPEKFFCNHDYEENRGTFGTCEECRNKNEVFKNDCFFMGLPLRGAQECASACGMMCELCPTDVSVTNLRGGIAKEGDQVCEFCPRGLQNEYQNHKVIIFGRELNCNLLDEFYRKYPILINDPNCQEAQAIRYLCGCDG